MEQINGDKYGNGDRSGPTIVRTAPSDRRKRCYGEIREKRWGNIHVHSIVVTLKTFTQGEFRDGCGVKRTQGVTTFNLLSIEFKEMRCKF